MKPILPPATLGVLGGGALGRYFVEAAARMGYRTAVLDPDPAAPAHRVADHSIVARYDDPAALELLASRSAAITAELEGMPASSVQQLARRVRVTPGADAIAIGQDRVRQKRFLRALGLDVAPFVEVLAGTELEAAGCFPGLLKTARNGHDGIGQMRVSDRRDARGAWKALGAVPCVLEKAMPIERELAVVLARTREGEVRAYPVAETRHRNGILELCAVPAEAPDAWCEQALEAAARVAQALQYEGVMAVEFFVAGGRLLVNEFAPRPHASALYTLDACDCSQFEQQVRVLTGQPLGPASLRSPAALATLLDEAWRAGEPAWGRLLAKSDGRLHLQAQGAGAERGRKRGHVTFLAETSAAALARAERLVAALRGESARASTGR